MKITHATISPSGIDYVWHDWTYLKYETGKEDICSDIDCDSAFSRLFTSCDTKEGSTSQLDQDAKNVRSYED